MTTPATTTTATQDVRAAVEQLSRVGMWRELGEIARLAAEMDEARMAWSRASSTLSESALRQLDLNRIEAERAVRAACDMWI